MFQQLFSEDKESAAQKFEMNSFALCSQMNRDFKFNSGQVFKEQMSTIQYLSSFFNHSCESNVAHLEIGDIQITIAVKQVMAGHELTTSYVNAFETYEDSCPMRVRELLRRQYRFDCECDICTMQPSVVCVSLDAMYCYSVQFLDVEEPNFSRIFEQIQAIDDLYSDFHVIRRQRGLFLLLT